MIYLKLQEDVKLSKQIVLLEDVAQITGMNKDQEKKLMHLEVFRFTEKREQCVVLGIIGIIEKIHDVYPDEKISSIGEKDVVVSYKEHEKPSVVMNVIKISFVCGICFFGSAFSIMAFHNDIGLQNLITQIYEIFGLSREGSFPVIEIGYSLGLGGGIILFYNHIGKRRITKDPTPIEVEMRLYEKDVNETIIDNATRLAKEE